MNREELLQFLEKKKVATAPVAAAEKSFRECQGRLNQAEAKWRKIIMIFAGLAAVWLLLGILGGDFNGIYIDRHGNLQLGGLGGTMLWGAVAAALIFIKQKMYVSPAEEVYAEAAEALKIAKSNSDYMNEAKDFPEKFYNYSDIFTLGSSSVRGGRII